MSRRNRGAPTLIAEGPDWIPRLATPDDVEADAVRTTVVDVATYETAKEAWHLAELRLVRAERIERLARDEAAAASVRASHDPGARDAHDRADEAAYRALASLRRARHEQEKAYETFMATNRAYQATLARGEVGR